MSVNEKRLILVDTRIIIANLFASFEWPNHLNSKLQRIIYNVE